MFAHLEIIIKINVKNYELHKVKSHDKNHPKYKHIKNSTQRNINNKKPTDNKHPTL